MRLGEVKVLIIIVVQMCNFATCAIYLFFTPLNHVGGGGAVRPSLACFLSLTQNYLEASIILDLANLFVSDAPMKKKS